MFTLVLSQFESLWVKQLVCQNILLYLQMNISLVYDDIDELIC